MNVQDHGTVEKQIDPTPRLKIQIATSTSITLGNKDFGAWDILTDFSHLGSPHTQMNIHLAQSGQNFPQI